MSFRERFIFRRVAAAAFAGVWFAGCVPRVAPHPSTARAPTCTVYFSPRGGCTEQIVRAIREAHHGILVQAYSFTSAPITQALIDASRRGVSVAVLVDKSQQTAHHTAADDLIKAGIPVAVDGAHAIAHNKVMVIDGEAVITGSFNFTESAEERNAENLLVIRDPELAVAYARNWHVHEEHSVPYAVAQASSRR